MGIAEVRTGFIGAVTAFILGAGGGYIGSDYMNLESADNLRADLETKFSQVPCDTASDRVVDVVVRDSVGDSVGVVQAVDNIQRKWNPSYITDGTETVYTVVWIKKPDGTVSAIQYGAYKPLAQRYIVSYVTTAEAN